MCWIHWWNPFLNPFTITVDICNFVLAASALSNRSLRSVYNYARRLILRTGLRPVQLFLVLYERSQQSFFTCFNVCNFISRMLHNITTATTTPMSLSSYRRTPQVVVRDEKSRFLKTQINSARLHALARSELVWTNLHLGFAQWVFVAFPIFPCYANTKWLGVTVQVASVQVARVISSVPPTTFPLLCTARVLQQVVVLVFCAELHFELVPQSVTFRQTTRKDGFISQPAWLPHRDGTGSPSHGSAGRVTGSTIWVRIGSGRVGSRVKALTRLFDPDS